MKKRARREKRKVRISNQHRRIHILRKQTTIVYSKILLKKILEKSGPKRY